MRLPSQREQITLFAKNFFRHPKMLGSLIPSSAFLVRKLLGQVDWERAKVMVEYGPGVGTFTREILHRMRPDAVLILLETNLEFVSYLRRSLPDPRLRIVHASAAEIRRVLNEHGCRRADYVISGIPFATLQEQQITDILQETRDALQPEGVFLVYQFSPKVLPYLRQVFPTVVRDFEPLNLLPAQLFYCFP